MTHPHERSSVSADQAGPDQSGPNPAGPASSDPPARFPSAVDAALRVAGWEPGRRDMSQAEVWADTLRAHVSPGGHRHAVFPAAVEVWAEFGGLPISGTGPGRHIAPTTMLVDPLCGLHSARTLADLGRALGSEIAPLGQEADGSALLAIDVVGRVYSIDHTGDWYLGPDVDAALTLLLTGVRPVRLSADEPSVGSLAEGP